MRDAKPWDLPRLIAITDLTVLPQDALVAALQRLAQAAVPGKVALLLRDHAANAKQRLALGQQLRQVAQDAQQQLWVADRLDLALLLEADGLHLGEGSVSATVARRLVGSAVRISRAWHAASLVDALAAGTGKSLIDAPAAGTGESLVDTPAAGTDDLADVDALLVSPLLAARKGRLALGVSALGVLSQQLRARDWAGQIYALGGVSAENAASCRLAGAYGVAAIGAALGNDAQALLGALELLR